MRMDSFKSDRSPCYQSKIKIQLGKGSRQRFVCLRIIKNIICVLYILLYFPLGYFHLKFKFLKESCYCVLIWRQISR